jgi:hypothetical protein
MNLTEGESSLKIIQHQYVERDTGQVCSERPIGDWIVNYLYSKRREEVLLSINCLAVNGSPAFSAGLIMIFRWGRT